ncbi:NUDIX hydrolase [Alicyclobacillus dauci]|uniref:NUDIX hydrolase n=1 Tax=Alicyclobacillus dauci TaxID=1475485 RepID=A0ABY6Z2W4_9BACL|nr:NUDIX hydrolase [Alicyclobacillus dauci]
MTANYCLVCGHKLETRNIGGTLRRACPACDFVHWGTYSIGVGAVVVRDGKVLLVRRAQDPGRGLWTNPGGFSEQLEVIDKGIEREVLEETGVVATASRIISMRDKPGEAHNLYVVFLMDYVEGEPRSDDVEVDAAGFFSPEEMAGMNVAGLTRWLVGAALNGSGGGLVLDEEPTLSQKGNRLFRV